MKQQAHTLEKRFQEPRGWKWNEFTNEHGLHIRTGELIVSRDPVSEQYLSPGMGLPGEILFETVLNLAELGHNVHVFVPSGQGGSGLHLTDRFHRSAGGYDADADDLNSFGKKRVRSDAPKIVTAASMSGTIATLAVMKNKKIFQALNLIDPFFGFANPKAPMLKRLLEASPYWPEWFSKHYAPGEGSWKSRSDPSRRLQASDYSSDPERMQVYDEWTVNHPELRVGGLTLGGFLEACRSHDKILAEGVPESIRVPMQIFSAGKNLVTSRSAIAEFSRRAGIIPHDFPDAKHDLLMERDEFRDEIILNIHNQAKGLSL
jgi:lysophospholipase